MPYGNIRIAGIMPSLMLYLMLFNIAGCAIQDPNPGELSANVAWSKADYKHALEIIEPEAEKGAPWAALKLGFAYELGNGYSKDIGKAIYWYKRAAMKIAQGYWPNGVISGPRKGGLFQSK